MSTKNKEVKSETVKTIKASYSLADAASAKETSLWVFNRSNPKGIINITMSDGMGNNLVIQVPVTFIPVDLTTQATRAAILSSPNFRRMVSIGILQIVPEILALKHMETPEAQKEAARVYSLTSENMMSDLDIPAEVKTVQAEAGGEVSGFAMQLALAEGIDEDQALNTLRGNESVLQKADYEYLAANSEFSRVKAYCSEKLVGGDTDEMNDAQ